MWGQIIKAQYREDVSRCRSHGSEGIFFIAICSARCSLEVVVALILFLSVCFQESRKVVDHHNHLFKNKEYGDRLRRQVLDNEARKSKAMHEHNDFAQLEGATVRPRSLL